MSSGLLERDLVFTKKLLIIVDVIEEVLWRDVIVTAETSSELADKFIHRLMESHHVKNELTVEVMYSQREEGTT